MLGISTTAEASMDSVWTKLPELKVPVPDWGSVGDFSVSNIVRIRALASVSARRIVRIEVSHDPYP